MSKILLFISLFVATSSIYDLTIQNIDGSLTALGNYQGKKILIVNIATHSRFANQLQSLEQLYQKYKDSLVIIAVPSNSFGNEPVSKEIIKNILTQHYNVHYTITDTMAVTGANQSALFKWLTTANENGHMNTTVSGDFQKYIVGSDGRLIGYFIPGVDPMDSLVQKTIENKLITQ